VKKVSTDLIKFGNVQRGFIGLAPVELNNKNAKEFDSDLDEGIYVAEVPEDGAANDAGIKKGDVITKVDGIETRSEPKFRELIGRKRPGEKVNLTVNRNGNVKDYTVTLRNNKGGEGIVKKDPELASTFGKLGIELAELSSKEKEKIGLRNGVRIAEIDKEGFFGEQTNIQEGFIITRVGNAKVNSTKEVKDQINLAKKNGEEGVLICGVYEGSTSRNYCVGIPVE
jgi:S1-C subfamily serine protease